MRAFNHLGGLIVLHDGQLLEKVVPNPYTEITILNGATSENINSYRLSDDGTELVLITDDYRAAEQLQICRDRLSRLKASRAAAVSREALEAQLDTRDIDRLSNEDLVRFDRQLFPESHEPDEPSA